MFENKSPLPSSPGSRPNKTFISFIRELKKSCIAETAPEKADFKFSTVSPSPASTLSASPTTFFSFNPRSSNMTPIISPRNVNSMVSPSIVPLNKNPPNCPRIVPRPWKNGASASIIGFKAIYILLIAPVILSNNDIFLGSPSSPIGFVNSKNKLIIPSKMGDIKSRALPMVSTTTLTDFPTIENTPDIFARTVLIFSIRVKPSSEFICAFIYVKKSSIALLNSCILTAKSAFINTKVLLKSSAVGMSWPKNSHNSPNNSFIESKVSLNLAPPSPPASHNLVTSSIHPAIPVKRSKNPPSASLVKKSLASFNLPNNLSNTFEKLLDTASLTAVITSLKLRASRAAKNALTPVSVYFLGN